MVCIQVATGNKMRASWTILYILYSKEIVINPYRYLLVVT